MSISAKQVAELREKTGSGLMDCKKALIETAGDIQAAVDYLRKKDGAKAEKKSQRIATDGVVALELDQQNKQWGAVVEINCETDFVAKQKSLIDLAHTVLDQANTAQVTDVSALGQLGPEGNSIEKQRCELVATLGENIQIRRVDVFSASASGYVGGYLHNNNKIGVLVSMEGDDQSVGNEIAMHIAAMKPEAVSGDQLDQDTIAKEREIFLSQIENMNKPDEIKEKIVQGKLSKFVDDVTLLGQDFVKDPKVKVRDYLAQKKVKVNDFVRFELGEGLEKKVENFAEEVEKVKRGS